MKPVAGLGGSDGPSGGRRGGWGIPGDRCGRCGCPGGCGAGMGDAGGCWCRCLPGRRWDALDVDDAYVAAGHDETAGGEGRSGGGRRGQVARLAECKGMTRRHGQGEDRQADLQQAAGVPGGTPDGSSGARPGGGSGRGPDGGRGRQGGKPCGHGAAAARAAAGGIRSLAVRIAGLRHDGSTTWCERERRRICAGVAVQGTRDGAHTRMARPQLKRDPPWRALWWGSLSPGRGMGAGCRPSGGAGRGRGMNAAGRLDGWWPCCLFGACVCRAGATGGRAP